MYHSRGGVSVGSVGAIAPTVFVPTVLKKSIIFANNNKLQPQYDIPNANPDSNDEEYKRNSSSMLRTPGGMLSNASVMLGNEETMSHDTK